MYFLMIKKLKPPLKWELPVIILIAAIVGISIYMFKASNAISYLSDSPEACVNCHIMTPEYATWNHSSHREKASCNDCHIPHDNIFNKYRFKASDGIRHATLFTLRKEPQVIHIKEAGVAVVQENCKRCHEELNTDVSVGKYTFEDAHSGEGRLCWECHREIPHGRVKGLSSTPDANIPPKEIIVPSGLKKILK